MGENYFLQYIDEDGDLMTLTIPGAYSPDDWNDAIEKLKIEGRTKWRLIQEHRVYETIRSAGEW